MQTYQTYCYMVSVEGREAPKKFYYDEADANKEAVRLANKEYPRIVNVLKLISRFQAEMTVKTISLPQDMPGGIPSANYQALANTNKAEF